MGEYFDDASQKIYIGTTNHAENHIDISILSPKELDELLHTKKIESTNLEEKFDPEPQNQDIDKQTEQDINIIITNNENSNIRIDIDVEELEAYVKERIFGQYIRKRIFYSLFLTSVYKIRNKVFLFHAISIRSKKI